MVGSWLIQRGSCCTFWIPSPKGILKKLEGFQAPILRIRLGVPKITSKLGTVTESRRLAPTDLQAMEQLRTRLRVVGKPPPFFAAMSFRRLLSHQYYSAVTTASVGCCVLLVRYSGYTRSRFFLARVCSCSSILGAQSRMKSLHMFMQVRPVCRPMWTEWTGVDFWQIGASGFLWIRQPGPFFVDGWCCASALFTADITFHGQVARVDIHFSRWRTLQSSQSLLH